MKFDFLIVGQGLAGSILAFELIKNNMKVLVIDNNHNGSASLVALGLINPLSGMRFTIPADIDGWLLSAHRVYSDLGVIKNRIYFNDINTLRILRSSEQKRFLERNLKKLVDEEYIKEDYSLRSIQKNFKCPFGGFLQKKTGSIEVQKLLNDCKDWLKSCDSYMADKLDYDKIKISRTEIKIGCLKAKKIIFCEGYRMSENPWFKPLPLQPDKGEYFEIKNSQIACDKIINGSSILLPKGKDIYHFGSTHQHKEINELPSMISQKKLINMQNNFFMRREDCELTAQYSGIRPSTSDRHPFIGHHPLEKKIYIFNGFGAKGCLTIPWYAEKLSEHLLQNRSLPPEADSGRFKDLFC